MSKEAKKKNAKKCKRISTKLVADAGNADAHENEIMRQSGLILAPTPRKRRESCESTRRTDPPANAFRSHVSCLLKPWTQERAANGSVGGVMRGVHIRIYLLRPWVLPSSTTRPPSLLSSLLPRPFSFPGPPCTMRCVHMHVLFLRRRVWWFIGWQEGGRPVSRGGGGCVVSEVAKGRGG